MAVHFWKFLEKRSDGRFKFHRSSHRVNETLAALAKGPKYQNSYRLDSDKPFKIDQVDKIVKSVMMNTLDEISYDPMECPALCTQVASEIRKRLLKINYDRYKIVVVVTIIEKASQSLESGMGFVWDADRDNYSAYSFETQTFFAYCFVTGIYCE